MIQSFLNVFLPEDEHKRARILYFMAEATFLSVGILLLVGTFKYVFNFVFDTEIFVMLGPFVMMAYVYLRYIFSGIEFTEVMSKGEYKQQRHVVVKRALAVGILFFLLSLFIKGIPTNSEELIDSLAISIIFSIFYFLFDFISLKRSFEKNRALTDDE